MKKLLLLIFVSVSLAFPQSRPTVNQVMTWDGQRGRYQTLSSDWITEGSSNLFYTQVRVRTSLSAYSPLKYNSSTGLFTLPLTVIAPITYDSTLGKFNLQGINGYGIPYSVLGVNAAGTALQYNKIVAGPNITINQSNDTIKITSSGSGSGGSALSFLNNSTDGVHISHPGAITVDVTNGLALAFTNAGDTSGTISIPTAGAMTLGTLNLTTLNISSQNNKVLYQTGGVVSGVAFGGVHTFLLGKGATTSPVMGSFATTYGLNLNWDDVLNVLTFQIDSTKYATVTADGLKALKATTITAGTGLSGGGDLSANRTINIANSGATAGTYGSGNSAPTITVNAQGQITSASSTHLTHADSSDYSTRNIYGDAHLGAGDSVQFTIATTDTSWGGVAGWDWLSQQGVGADGGTLAVTCYAGGKTTIKSLTAQTIQNRRVFFELFKKTYHF